MSVFGIRRKLKAGVKKALGMEEGPSDTAAPNWQNRPPAAPPSAAQAASTEAPAAEPDPQLSAESAPTEEAPPAAEASPAEPELSADASSEEEPEVTEPVVETAAAESEAAADSSEASDDVVGEALTMEAVQEILDDMVRPALQGDGGDISLLKIEDNDVYVKLVGACTTCPSSIMTMKMGVEALLREEFPSMRELIQVDAQPIA